MKKTAMPSRLMRTLLFCLLLLALFCFADILSVWNKQQCLYTGAGIAALSFTSCSLLLHWHPIWQDSPMNHPSRFFEKDILRSQRLSFFCFTGIQPGFIFLFHPEVVFGRVREGAFDAKASSRKYSSPFPVPVTAARRRLFRRLRGFGDPSRRIAPRRYVPFPAAAYTYGSGRYRRRW